LLQARTSVGGKTAEAGHESNLDPIRTLMAAGPNAAMMAAGTVRRLAIPPRGSLGPAFHLPASTLYKVTRLVSLASYVAITAYCAE